MRGALLEESRGENLLGKPRRRLEDIIKKALEHKIRVFELGSPEAEQGREGSYCKNDNEPSRFTQGWEFLNNLSKYSEGGICLLELVSVSTSLVWDVWESNVKNISLDSNIF